MRTTQTHRTQIFFRFHWIIVVYPIIQEICLMDNHQIFLLSDMYYSLAVASLHKLATEKYCIIMHLRATSFEIHTLNLFKIIK